MTSLGGANADDLPPLSANEMRKLMSKALIKVRVGLWFPHHNSFASTTIVARFPLRCFGSPHLFMSNPALAHCWYCPPLSKYDCIWKPLSLAH